MEKFVVFSCKCGRFLIGGKWLFLDEMKPKEIKKIEDGFSNGTIHDKPYICSNCRG